MANTESSILACSIYSFYLIDLDWSIVFCGESPLQEGSGVGLGGSASGPNSPPNPTPDSSSSVLAATGSGSDPKIKQEEQPQSLGGTSSTRGYKLGSPEISSQVGNADTTINYVVRIYDGAPSHLGDSLHEVGQLSGYEWGIDWRGQEVCSGTVVNPRLVKHNDLRGTTSPVTSPQPNEAFGKRRFNHYYDQSHTARIKSEILPQLRNGLRDDLPTVVMDNLNDKEYARTLYPPRGHGGSGARAINK